MRNTLIVLFICLLSFNNSVKAQFRYDLQGRPITEISYTDIEGDPYLVNGWVPGTVTLQNNKSVQLPLKYDDYSDRLLFQGKDDAMMEFQDKLTMFTLTGSNKEISDLTPLTFVNGFPAIEKQTPASWYQIIADGKVKLLKYHKKIVTEYKAFNSATTTKTFNAIQNYFIFKNNQLTQLSIGKKSILKALDDHSAQIETYLKTNSVNVKSDQDLQKLFNYYNSLN